jgi:serine/threonine protein kinase
MSPELLNGEPYTFAADIWALGCIACEMATRERAFNARTLPALIMQILQCGYKPVPSHYSRPLATMVDSMLRAAPEVRLPSAWGGPDILRIEKCSDEAMARLPQHDLIDVASLTMVDQHDTRPQLGGVITTDACSDTQERPTAGALLSLPIVRRHTEQLLGIPLSLEPDASLTLRPVPELPKGCFSSSPLRRAGKNSPRGSPNRRGRSDTPSLGDAKREPSPSGSRDSKGKAKTVSEFAATYSRVSLSGAGGRPGLSGA